jgi:CubicO group peptidase (beta-lactamase class C family)
MEPGLRTSLLVIVLMLIAVPLRADAVDDFINAELQRQNVPGLSLAVLKDGIIVKSGGYGFADRARQVRATPDTDVQDRVYQ